VSTMSSDRKNNKSGVNRFLAEKGQVLLDLIWSLVRNTPVRLKRLAVLLAVRPFKALGRNKEPSTDYERADTSENATDAKRDSAGTGKKVLLNILGRPLAWIGRIVFASLELVALGEILQVLWNLVFRTRRLTEKEIAAFRSVFPDLKFRPEQVRVHPKSPICQINGKRAVTSFYLIHLPNETIGTDVMVHELAHVLQYEVVGGVYMFEALFAQFFGGGYSYGDLGDQWEKGIRLSAFNREQQAQICQDYYRVSNGKRPWYGGSVETLEPYMGDWRSLSV